MHENAQKLEWKIQRKFPASTRGYTMVKTAHLDDAFSEVFERKQAQ